MKIAVFHYHLRPGHVTDYIVSSCRAMLSLMNEVQELRLVCGEESGAKDVMQAIREGLSPAAADKLRLDVLEELAAAGNRRGDAAGNSAGDSELHTTIVNRLEARYGEDTLLWVHNYHSGENPAFTRALSVLARNNSRNMLLHIHQFPECRNLEQLWYTAAPGEEAPYPTGARVRYAAINGRDQRILADSGLGDSAHFLPAPLQQPPYETPDEDEVRNALRELNPETHPGYVPGAPLLLCPAGPFAGKNILEAAIFSRLLENPANLLVCGEDAGGKDSRYAAAVQDLFRSGAVAGVWQPQGSGDARLSFARLASSCNAFITTSVDEISGQVFLEALYRQKPLLARYLDILDGILDVFGNYPRRFWADFSIPVTRETARKTQEAYQNKLKQLSSILPAKSTKSINSAIAKISTGGTIDVSFLSVESQAAILEQARTDQAWIEDARSINRELLESSERTLCAHAPDMTRHIESRFGSGIFTRNLQDVLADFGVKRSSPSPDKIRESVLKAFGRIDSLRLLRDY